MAAEAVAVGRWQGFVNFLRDSYHEIRFKTTWPDFPQIRQASIAIVIFVLLIGLVISIVDTVLGLVLVRGIQGLFR